MRSWRTERGVPSAGAPAGLVGRPDAALDAPGWGLTAGEYGDGSGQHITAARAWTAAGVCGAESDMALCWGRSSRGAAGASAAVLTILDTHIAGPTRCGALLGQGLCYEVPGPLSAQERLLRSPDQNLSCYNRTYHD
jgi:hypothetical protein